jgi:drug/metabolite transporter (DMT)-like permease
MHVTTSNLPAICYALLGATSMAAVDVAMKWLVADYSVSQLLAIRGWFLLPVTFIWYLRSDQRQHAPLADWKLLTLRAGVLQVAPFLFFTGLLYVPLADATVLFFMAPLFIVAASAVIFGDKVNLYRWLAVAAGFTGCLFVLRPGFSAFQVEALFPLGAAVFYGVAMLLSRQLNGRSSLARILLFQTVGWAVIHGCLATFAWSPMPLKDLALVGGMAVLNFTTMIGLTKAYMTAPAHVVGPFEYVALPLAILFGFLLWNENPDTPVYVGAALIVGAGIFVLIQETTFASQKHKKCSPLNSSANKSSLPVS